MAGERNMLLRRHLPALMAGLLAPAAQAQEAWPRRAVTLVVPFATDVESALSVSSEGGYFRGAEGKRE